jgi:hypothetical protein
MLGCLRRRGRPWDQDRQSLLITMAFILWAMSSASVAAALGTGHGARLHGAFIPLEPLSSFGSARRPPVGCRPVAFISTFSLGALSSLQRRRSGRRLCIAFTSAFIPGGAVFIERGVRLDRDPPVFASPSPAPLSLGAVFRKRRAVGPRSSSPAAHFIAGCGIQAHGRPWTGTWGVASALSGRTAGSETFAIVADIQSWPIDGFLTPRTLLVAAYRSGVIVVLVAASA